MSTTLDGIRATYRLRYRVINAGELAKIEVWKNEGWRYFIPPVDHATAGNYIATLRTGGSVVEDERK